ncbi:MAG: DoxX family protein [Paracoccaceae bacterium]
MTDMPEMTSSPRERLVLPFLAPLYHHIAQPVGWLALRVVVGGYLMVEGWPKITAPMAMSGFVESLGFSPGWFFSPLLAVLNFVGGALIILGLFTRPVALANAVMLGVTWWFHVSHPYGPDFLTPEGIAFLQANLQYLTAAGQENLLPDGGATFLSLVQMKAETNSLFWAGATALFAAYGGAHYSIDRLLRKEF